MEHLAASLPGVQVVLYNGDQRLECVRPVSVCVSVCLCLSVFLCLSVSLSVSLTPTLCL
jgi:hypothetical protein